MAEPSFIDDKTPICIPFVLNLLQTYEASRATKSQSPTRPFVIGLNGVQGAGKTTLVSNLAAALDKEGVHTLVCSIDDFYLKHDDQVALAARYADNKLLQHRGEPGTHDIELAVSVFTALINGQPTMIPQYDKSAFSGQGDRLPESQCLPVNHPSQPPVRAIILEGWSVGFRPLPDTAAIQARRDSPSRTLRHHALEHLVLVNEKLRAYDALTDLFDAFIQIDAEDLGYVYEWRQQQEDHLRQKKGDPTAGMTPEQVVKFVDGYFPAYELYTEGVRKGILSDRPGWQLRMIVGKDRKVKETVKT